MTSYCVFNIGPRRIGIPLTHVREILDHQHIHPTPIPLTPPQIHGLFNLRGQVLPYLDLSTYVGAPAPAAPPGRDDRALIIERGPFRFATTGRHIATVEIDPDTFTLPDHAALFPALQAQARTDTDHFQILHLDRLEACLSQSLKHTEATTANTSAAVSTDTPSTTAGPNNLSNSPQP